MTLGRFGAYVLVGQAVAFGVCWAGTQAVAVVRRAVAQVATR